MRGCLSLVETGHNRWKTAIFRLLATRQHRNRFPRDCRVGKEELVDWFAGALAPRNELRKA